MNAPHVATQAWRFPLTAALRQSSPAPPSRWWIAPAEERGLHRPEPLRDLERLAPARLAEVGPGRMRAHLPSPIPWPQHVGGGFEQLFSVSAVLHGSSASRSAPGPFRHSARNRRETTVAAQGPPTSPTIARFTLRTSKSKRPRSCARATTNAQTLRGRTAQFTTFNTVFVRHTDSGHLGNTTLTAFVAADDAGAKKDVLELACEVGLDAVDTGPLRNARLLEPFAYSTSSSATRWGWARKSDSSPPVGYPETIHANGWILETALCRQTRLHAIGWILRPSV